MDRQAAVRDSTDLKRETSVGSIDLQEVQEVQVCRSLLWDQFDPRHDKQKKTSLTSLLFHWFFIFVIAPTLTDDPLAPLGPGGP